QKFTGYQKDEETQLDFAEARMYQNQHARFTAVDPLLASGKSANPQTFNRYVYVVNNPLIFVDPDGLQVAAAVDEVVIRIHTIITKAGDYITRTFSYGGDTVKVRERVPVFDSISGSDPLQNRNYQRFESAMNLTLGADDGQSLSRLIGNKGPTVNSVLDQTNRSYDAARKIGEINLAFQSVYSGAVSTFMPNASRSLATPNASSLRQNSGASSNLKAFPSRDSVQFPAIKAGSAGGPTSGKRYVTVDVRRQNAQDNPNQYCVFCRQVATKPHLDHAIPVSQGGNSTIKNIQTACEFCNLSKGDRLFPVNPAPGYEGPFPPPWWRVQ
ncbi:MAG: HNH endonuclease, partial [Acidobacteria bacterium]|nr:HNH endonuclease [Acidobacteriota bacterium]